MGAGKITPQVRDWVLGNAYQDREFEQHNVAANVHGTLFNTWAGEVSVATGVEYRVFSSGGGIDANSAAAVYRQQAVSILPQTEQKVTEGYLEVSVPLLRDSPLGKTLDVDGAVRRTSYSLSGDATTWKIGAVYEPTDELMFRATKSNDIRAPSPAELNPNQISRDLTQADPTLGIQYQMPAKLGGNPNLQLEQADTFTVGAVYKPSWLSRFRISLDYYDIKVEDAIDTVSIPLAVLICRAGTNPDICVIGTDALGNTNRILQLYATYQNVNELNAEGYELVTNYSFDLADVYKPLSGTLDLTLNANYVNTLSTTLPDGTLREFAGQTGNAGSVTTIFGVPRWRADLVMTYSQPRWSATAQVKYIPEGILNRDWIGPDHPNYSPYLTNSVNNNRIASATYLNLNARVKLTGEDKGNIELFGGVNNVANLDPPANLRFTGNGLYFDPIGRAYRIGLRANW
jgi:outer membrane receptor protein involved in Fe transport